MSTLFLYCFSVVTINWNQRFVNISILNFSCFFLFFKTFVDAFSCFLSLVVCFSFLLISV